MIKAIPTFVAMESFELVDGKYEMTTAHINVEYVVSVRDVLDPLPDEYFKQILGDGPDPEVLKEMREETFQCAVTLVDGREITVLGTPEGLFNSIGYQVCNNAVDLYVDHVSREQARGSLPDTL
jgi:hypothetical protein